MPVQEPVQEPEQEQVRGRGQVRFKRDAEVRVEAPVRFMAPTTFATRTSIGAFSYFVGGTIDHCDRIGRYCSLAGGVRVGEPDHPVDWLSTSPFAYDATRFGWHPDGAAPVLRHDAGAAGTFRRGPVTIGHDVWIGANAVVRRGVEIGHGAVVGAGAVVVADVAPYAVVGGVPARTIRQRFDDDVVADLLGVAWWRFAPRQLAGLDLADPRAAADRLRDRITGGLEPWTGEEVLLRQEPPSPPADQRGRRRLGRRRGRMAP